MIKDNWNSGSEKESTEGKEDYGETIYNEKHMLQVVQKVPSYPREEKNRYNITDESLKVGQGELSIEKNHCAEPADGEKPDAVAIEGDKPEAKACKSADGVSATITRNRNPDDIS